MEELKHFHDYSCSENNRFVKETQFLSQNLLGPFLDRPIGYGVIFNS